LIQRAVENRLGPISLVLKYAKYVSGELSLQSSQPSTCHFFESQPGPILPIL
jgi:hypothetical protein